MRVHARLPKRVGGKQQERKGKRRGCWRVKRSKNIIIYMKIA
jgi:hypothetical protein